ncbi:hypothetical protein GCM10027187_36520 [Streptosporangium sandarakinum]
MALLYTIRQNGARLGVPEVIEREIRKQILQSGLEAHERMVKSGRLLQRILNSSVDPIISSASPAPKIRRAIDVRLAELEGMLIRVPLTLDHVRRALDRVDSATPPSGGRKQQYKDCLIWEAASELASEWIVYIVSQDGAFFDGSHLTKPLVEECKRKNVIIKAFRSLQDLIKELVPQAPAVDYEALEQVVRIEGAVAAQDNLRRERWMTLGDLQDINLQVFATEEPEKLSVMFEAIFTLSGSPSMVVKEGLSGKAKRVPIENEPILDPSIRVQGSFLYDTRSREAADFTSNKADISWVGEDGIRRRGSSIYSAGGSTTLLAGPAITTVSGDAVFQFQDEM